MVAFHSSMSTCLFVVRANSTEAVLNMLASAGSDHATNKQQDVKKMKTFVDEKFYVGDLSNIRQTLHNNLQNEVNGTATLITSLQPYVALEKCVAGMENGFITCMRKIVQLYEGDQCHLQLPPSW